eukprot:TRINITY_DN14625_c0_g2_i2.p1 TRINITY_DN14625_c0_g2~~TRINITY_DN14625_c0_g2_i2.p1  ORF type:complete len:256 (+),score=64.31 TRINITY_DN14625_c0_g2_i2:65-832(+)
MSHWRHLSEDGGSSMMRRDLLGVAGCAMGCWVFDKFVATPLFKTKQDDGKVEIDENGRWFMLHAAANAVVSVATVPDVVGTLMSPKRALDVNLNRPVLPVYMIGAVHMYHCLAFSNLTPDDWFHHIVFGGTIVTMGLCFKAGRMVNALSFTLSGFPGGLDYVLLCLVKLGYITSLFEKRWNARIMTWIRNPLTTVLSYILFREIAFKEDIKASTRIEIAAATVVALLVYFNGNYYSQRVIGNAYKKDEGINKVGC